MKEEELGGLLGELAQAEAFIASFVAGLPPQPPLAPATAGGAASGPAGGEDGGADSGEAAGGPQLEVVGTAVALDPLAASAAAALVGDAPAEVLALPAGEAAEQGLGLIPAYYADRQGEEAGPGSCAAQCGASAGGADAGAGPPASTAVPGQEGAAAPDSPAGTGAAKPAPPPTSRQFWQERVDAVLPPAVARAWALLERQASQQLAALQGRTASADEVRRLVGNCRCAGRCNCLSTRASTDAMPMRCTPVQVLALQRENEALKGTLAALLNSPLNKQLQLPPTLLLR